MFRWQQGRSCGGLDRGQAVYLCVCVCVCVCSVGVGQACPCTQLQPCGHDKGLPVVQEATPSMWVHASGMSERSLRCFPYQKLQCPWTTCAAALLEMMQGNDLHFRSRTQT